MTELPVGDDGFLRMEQFSDAEVTDAELDGEPWFADPALADVAALPEAAWIRLVSGAVSDAGAHPELDALVDPAPAVDEGDPVHPDDVDQGPYGVGDHDDPPVPDDLGSTHEAGVHGEAGYSEPGSPASEHAVDGEHGW